MRVRVRVAGLLCVAASVVGVVVVSPPAAAYFYVVGTPYPLVTKLAVSHHSQMVEAKGRLFVTQDGAVPDVEVFNEGGQLEQEITNEPGAGGMAVSSDGATVYVADSAGTTISVINAATLDRQDITVDACPTSLAFAAGRLYYSFGCASGPPNSAGVSSIDPSTTDMPVVGTPALAAPPRLLGGGTTLLEVGNPSSLVSAFSASADGTLTAGQSDNFGRAPRDLAISPDGDDVYVAVAQGYGVGEYATSDFTGVQTIATHSLDPWSVAVSPDGSHVLVGADSATYTFALFDLASLSKPVWQRTAVPADPATWSTEPGDGDAAPLPGTLTFSQQSDEVFGLVTTPRLKGSYLFGSAFAPTTTTVGLTVRHTSVRSTVLAAVTLSTVGNVTLYATAGLRPAKPVATASTNVHGVANVRIRATYSGTLQAVFEGSPFSYPVASKTRTLSIPAAAKVTLSGAYAHRHGIALFHSAAKTDFTVSMTPAHANRHIVIALERKVDGTWISGVTHNVRLSAGSIKYRLGHGSKHVEYRIVVQFDGDHYNAAANGVSRPFEIT